MEDKEQDLISVVMGVYNQPDKQAMMDAVNSILNQTYKKIEFIIYDDGSDKEVSEFISSLKNLDKRIVVIGKKQNHGLAFSLNECITRAKGKYIARMDSDDISLPDRLRVQYDSMKENPDYSWCGTNAILFDSNGEWGERQMPEYPSESDYLRYSPYIHPSVMYRAEMFDNYQYLVSKDTMRCEDYEIFMRLRAAGLKGYNVQQSLFKYREENNPFHKRNFKFRIYECKIRYKNFKSLGIGGPKRILYSIRPVVGGLIPAGLATKIKKLESSRTNVKFYKK